MFYSCSAIFCNPSVPYFLEYIINFVIVIVSVCGDCEISFIIDRILMNSSCSRNFKILLSLRVMLGCLFRSLLSTKIFHSWVVCLYRELVLLLSWWFLKRELMWVLQQNSVLSRCFLQQLPVPWIVACSSDRWYYWRVILFMCVCVCVIWSQIILLSLIGVGLSSTWGD